MKLTIERSALLKALSSAASIVERKNTIPILSNLLVETVDAETARVVATDLDIQVSLTVPAQVSEPGGVTIEAFLLHGVVRESAEGCQVEISHAKGDARAAIVSGRNRTRLPTLPPEDFPSIGLKEEVSAFELPSKGLADALRICTPSISSEEARWYLNGVAVELEDAALCFASCDGHRLTAVRMELPAGAQGENGSCHGSILPKKLVAELVRLLADAEGSTSLAFGDGKVRLRVDGIEIVSKLIDGTYPDWRRTVPKPTEQVLGLDREAVTGAVRRVAFVSGGKDRIVAFDLSPDKLKASARSAESGEAEEEVPADWQGPELRIGFNGRYLAEMFGVMAAESVRFAIDAPTGPVLVTDAALPNAQFVLMPCKV